MGCSQLNIKEKKGIVIEMSNKKDTNKKDDRQKQVNLQDAAKTSEQNRQESLTQEMKELIQKSIADALEADKTRKRSMSRVVIEGVTVIALIIGGAFSVFTFFNDRFDKINDKFDTVNENLADCVTKEGFEEEIDKINETLNGDGSDDKPGLVTKVNTIEKLLEISPIFATSDIISSVDGVSKEPNNISEVGSSIEADTCIGTDAEGNVYLAEDLINETILLIYTEEDKEVYFLGQYNEDYKWNGYCVTNAYYTNGALYGICESNFDNGKRLDYKSFVLTEKNEWIYSDKVCNGEINSGVNILYSLYYDKIKSFTGANARITDMLYTDEFIETTNPVMMKYYSGNTIDGQYSDDSGKAYEIKYDEDGTVTLLYVGQFKDGTFNDMTGNAWEIVYAEKYGYYVCNTGNFKDGHTDNPSGTAINMDEITQIISDYDFSSELKWKYQ